MNKSPAFQWYPGDAESSLDCQAMSLEEYGFYHRLLDKAWVNSRQGYLPNDHKTLAKLVGIRQIKFSKLWEKLGKKFKITADKKAIFNPRQIKELRKQQERRRKLAENARKGGRPVKQKVSENKPIGKQKVSKNKPNGLPPENQKQSLSSSSSSSSSKKKRIPNGIPKESSPVADERRQVLMDFFFREYLRIRGIQLVVDASDMKHYEAMLTATRGKPEFTCDALGKSAQRYLECNRPYERNQGRPLRFWALNFQAYMVSQGANQRPWQPGESWKPEPEGIDAAARDKLLDEISKVKL